MFFSSKNERFQYVNFNQLNHFMERIGKGKRKNVTKSMFTRK